MNELVMLQPLPVIRLKCKMAPNIANNAFIAVALDFQDREFTGGWFSNQYHGVCW